MSFAARAAPGHYNIGIGYAVMRRHDDAVHHLRLALEEESSNGAWRRALETLEKGKIPWEGP
ncbi:MAG: hypothetical protein O7J95_05895 [Planctomycetota bacterium]|nr:hypothetical protein [Planctomycetota bacterium]